MKLSHQRRYVIPWGMTTIHVRIVGMITPTIRQKPPLAPNLLLLTTPNLHSLTLSYTLLLFFNFLRGGGRHTPIMR